MNREYYRWNSQRLGRDMELLVFGHAGAKVLVFPTRDGRFHEYEDLRLVESLSHKIQAGQLQLYCVDSIDWESLYCDWCHPADRIGRHSAFEEYVLNEVLPFMAMKNPHPCTIAHGCSLGAFHAVNIALRHPHRKRPVKAFFPPNPARDKLCPSIVEPNGGATQWAKRARGGAASVNGRR